MNKRQLKKHFKRGIEVRLVESGLSKKQARQASKISYAEKSEKYNDKKEFLSNFPTSIISKLDDLVNKERAATEALLLDVTIPDNFGREYGVDYTKDISANGERLNEFKELKKYTIEILEHYGFSKNASKEAKRFRDNIMSAQAMSLSKNLKEGNDKIAEMMFDYDPYKEMVDVYEESIKLGQSVKVFKQLFEAKMSDILTQYFADSEQEVAYNVSRDHNFNRNVSYGIDGLKGLSNK